MRRDRSPQTRLLHLEYPGRAMHATTAERGAQAMSTEENKAIARRWFEESGNRHNLAVVDELFTPDYVNHALGAAPGGGREAEKHLIAGMLTAFPDMRFTVEDMIAEGDKVAVRYMMRGTHQGAF